MQDVLRGLLSLLLVFADWSPAVADEPVHIAPRPFASALEALQGGRVERARELAARDGPGAVVLIDWMRLSGGGGTAAEALTFIAEHPDWPGLEALHRKYEDDVPPGDAEAVLAYYAEMPPRTGTGVLALARALGARGEAGEAQANVVLAWRTMDLSTAEHEAFLEAYADLLKPHHAARMEMAVWRGLRDVQVMMPLVGEEQRKLVELRQRVKAGEILGDETLTKEVKQDPGVAYELFNRAIKRNKRDEAETLILRQSRIEDGLGEPERWAGWRRSMARQRMRDKAWKTAYDLASQHHLVEGSNYADLEWLSGYLALTYLGVPDLALAHFQNFRDAVETPISLGRAGYWIGRAHEAAGEAEAAKAAYAFGAAYQTSFYGLLAAERGGFPPDPALDGKTGADWQSGAFLSSDVYQAGILLWAMGRLSQAERFFVHLAGQLDETELGRLGAALDAMGAPHLQVMVGKAAAKRGLTIPGPYYALHPLHKMDLPVPAEMALAIARRESEFDPNVVSGAGAQGLMQLMPGTASDVAMSLGLRHDRGRVLSDWRYNAQLGSAYLAQMAERFGGNVVMVSAAYNAGPGRPLRWMGTYGDPRAGEVDVVDWIEHIPFRETRNYVMRVAESLPVYRARLGKNPHPVPFSQELVGATLLGPQTD